MVKEMHPSGFEHRVITPLERFGRRIRRYVLVEGLCQCVSVLVGFALVQFALDRLLILGAGPRLVLLGGLVSLIGHQVYRRLIRPAGARVGAENVAAVLERRHPDFRDQLISAVAFAMGAGQNPHRNSPALVGALISQSASRFRDLSTRDLLRRDRHMRFLVLGLAAVILAASLTAASPDLAATYVARDILLKDVPWPVSTRIVVEGFRNRRRRWPIGDELTLVATAQDDVPSALRAEFQFPSGAELIRPMDRRGHDQFILDYGPLMKALKVRFLISRFGVDERTEWYEIEAVRRPSVKSVRIEVSPPSYVAQEPFALPQGRVSTDVIRGSRVRIEATLSKRVVEASLRTRADDRFVAGARIEGGTMVSTEFAPERRGTYYLDVRDDDGLADRQPVTYSIGLISDPPPKVRLTLPGAGELVVANAILQLVVDCEDNLGLRSVALVHQVLNGSASASEAVPRAHRKPLPDFVSRQMRYDLKQAFPLLPLTLVPGDQITLKVRASDFQPSAQAAETQPEAGGAGPPIGESLEYTLRVVTAEELLAELGRREHEWRREFEQIIKAQEQMSRRIMEIRDQAPAEPASSERSVRYAQEARTQRQQIGRLKTVSRQFQQILDELKVNQLAGPVVKRRLQRGVLTPLRELIGGEVASAAELMERLRWQFDESVADQLEREESGLLRKMYGILANMLKWEGYNEAIALLRDVVKLQQNLNRETQHYLEREIEKLFREEEAEPAPASQPEDDHED